MLKLNVMLKSRGFEGHSTNATKGTWTHKAKKLKVTRCIRNSERILELTTTDGKVSIYMLSYPEDVERFKQDLEVAVR